MAGSDLIKHSMAALLTSAALSPMAHGATAAGLEAAYTAQAGAPAIAAPGQELFTTRHGREWSCSSCLGAVPTRAGSHGRDDD